MTMTAQEQISFGRRISMLAAEHPDKTAIVFAPQGGQERVVSWRELDDRSTQIARLLAEHGVDESSTVVVGFPNWPEHFLADYAAWKLGALVVPVRFNIPLRERDQILEVANPTVVVSDWDDVPYPSLNSADLERSRTCSTEPLPDKVAHPGKSVGSGGSTGRPKIIVDPAPWARSLHNPRLQEVGGFRPGQVQLIAGPLYHNSPFSWSQYGLFYDQTLVLMERFDAAKAVDLIERYRANWMFLAPIMMRRIYLLPDIHERDLSSIEAIFHTAAPCPPWLKRAWIDLIGAEKIYESFGATEAIGSTTIRGDEWLEHPGSVGRPRDAEMKILDEEGNEVPQGEVGEIFFRPLKRDPTYYYIGSPPAKSTPDGFHSVGDMGWIDEDGYLFLADRRVDLIITGGANVYPAEVEGALTEHPEVADAAVVGVSDEEWGKRVHAIVQPRDLTSPPALEDLDAFCRDRIASYKLPKTYEFVDGLPRDGAGKLRRRSLAEDRASGDWPNMIPVRRR
jgi:bile acid-coenzyme A ligase